MNYKCDTAQMCAVGGLYDKEKEPNTWCTLYASVYCKDEDRQNCRLPDFSKVCLVSRYVCVCKPDRL